MTAAASPILQEPPDGPIVYHRDTVLTIEELAVALRASVRSIERMDLPTVYIGRKIRRYIYGQVLDHLAERAA